MDELPELTEADKRALDELDMTPILGPPEERLKRAVLFAVNRMREKNRLQAENERLKEEFQGACKESLEWMQQLARSNADNERLRAELDELKHEQGLCCDDCTLCADYLQEESSDE